MGTLWIAQRAQKSLAIGRGHYSMGQPIRVKPDRPWPKDGDCIAFACWCCGMDRSAKVQGERLWIDTSRCFHDATHEQRWFTTCDFQVGALVVYPDRWKDGEKEEGHVGIIVGGTCLADAETIECASSKKGLWRGTRKKAFWQTKKALIVRPKREPVVLP